MRKQDLYYIAGALIGISLANYLAQELFKENRRRTEECSERARRIVDKAIDEENERHIYEMNRIAEESCREMKKIADQQMEEITRIREKIARYKEELGMKDDEDVKPEDDKLRFS